MTIENVFQNIPAKLPDELTQTLIQSPNVRIERIVSRGHRSKQGEWYDQDQDEWILVLKGGARLVFEGESNHISLKKGDYLNIPKHKRHRVDWTATDTETIWLAIFY